MSVSDEFIQSVFGQHADQSSLMKRLEEDYGVSLRSGAKYPPVNITNPFSSRIDKNTTCKKSSLSKRKRDRRHGTLKRKK